LPDFVVKVDSINIFKDVDKRWFNQNVFDDTSALAEIGDRCEYVGGY